MKNIKRSYKNLKYMKIKTCHEELGDQKVQYQFIK